MEEMEKEKKVKFIKNPLPLPKKHTKKEMDYDFEVSADQMHFDIEEPVNNFYDF